MYNPGTHLIVSLVSDQQELLNSYEQFKTFTNHLIATHHLKMLGAVYHNFSPAGYTGVVCLSESHISIHTWPEHGLINMDIYLSNYERSNDDTVNKLYESYLDFFKAAVRELHTIKR
ncbi:MAG: adenosylmethionine decarboxylase [Chitinophagaceae bacterium]|nr:MAG: adenosylmethionine decarboxylase [Chitinophagaceae bacterium]